MDPNEEQMSPEEMAQIAAEFLKSFTEQFGEAETDNFINFCTQAAAEHEVELTYIELMQKVMTK